MSTPAIATSDNSRLLQHFWDLSKSDHDARVSAGAALLSALKQEVQGNNLTYTCDRLVAGLGSSNNSSRQGFAGALVELLRAFPDALSTEVFLSTVQRLLDLTHASSQQEKRDRYFGRVFVAHVLVRSGRLSSLNGTQLAALVNELLSFAQHKVWLREFVYDAIVAVINELPANKFESVVWPLISSQLHEDIGQMNLEQFMLALAVKQYYLKLGRSTDAMPSAALRHPVSAKNISKLAIMLKESISAHPRMHSAWPLVVNELFASASTSSPWLQFWNTVVEEGLMNGNPKHKFLGMQLLKHEFLGRLASHELPSLLSPNVLRTILNHACKRDHALQLASVDLLNAIVAEAHRPARIKDESGLTLALVLLSSERGGDRNFDSRTHTQTVKSLLSVLDEQGVCKYIEHLMTVFASTEPDVVREEPAEEVVNPKVAAKAEQRQQKLKKRDEEEMIETEMMTEDDEKAIRQQKLDARRVWVADQMCALARNVHLPRRESWLKTVIDFLVLYGFFHSDASAAAKPTKVKGKGKAAAEPVSTQVSVSAHVRQTCADRFFTVLSELVALSPRALTAEQDAAFAAQSASHAAAARATAAAKKAASKKGDQALKDMVEKAVAEAAAAAEAAGKAQSAVNVLPGQEGSTADGQLWAAYALSIWHDLESRPTLTLEINSKWTEEDKTANAEMRQTLVALQSQRAVLDKKAAAARTKKTKQASLALADQYRALELLFAHVGLLQLQEKSVSEATEVLQELQECYKNAFLAAPKKTKKKAKQEEEDEEEEPNFVEVLVDVMLSLLVKPSNLLRDVVKIVFASFCDQLTAEAVDDLLRVLTTRDKSSGEEDEDGKLFDMEDMDVDNDGGDGSELDEDSDDSDDEDDVADVAAAATSTKQSKSQDEESGDESEDLDLFAAESSAELEKYDEALANIIRLRKEKSSGAKELKQQSLNFKLRVLDLVEIYVRKQATNPLIWRCFRPMLEAIRVTPETDDKQALNARLVAAYGKLTKPKEYPKSGSLEDLNTCIEELVAHVGKCSTSQLLSLLRDGLAALLRSLLHPSMHAGGNVSAAVDQTAAMLVRLLQQFTSRKSKTLNLVFFTQLCGRFPAIGWKMLPSTLECVASARTLFLSLEALSVAQEILRYASQTSELPAILTANAKAFAHAVSYVLSHAELAKRVKPKRAREVLRLLQEYCRLVAKSGSVADVFGAEADVPALIEALNKSLTIQAYEPSLKSVVPSLIAQLNAPRTEAAAGKKRKAEKAQPTPKAEAKKAEPVAEASSKKAKKVKA